MNVENALYPTPEHARAFFHAPEDGPFVMLNLLKYRKTAAYPDGSDAHLSGAEAYARYGAVVSHLVVNLGGRILFNGAVTGLMIGTVDDLWDQVALVEYPSLKSFLDMNKDPAMQAVLHHRAAGLEGQLNIKVKQGTMADMLKAAARD